MKKLFAIALVLVMVLSLFACGKSETQTKTEEKYEIADNYPGQYRVGYARANITPETSTPMAGLGNVNQRMSNDILDQLYMFCVAFTGTNNETVLMYSIDNQFGINTNVFPTLVDSLADTIGVPKENIVYTCTHTHCGPASEGTSYFGIPEYNAKVASLIVSLAVEAMNDRSPATLTAGDVEAEGLNFVKHYMNTLADGTKEYFGDNFGTASVDETTQHTLKADPTVHLVRIEREGKKPVVLMNFRAHPHFNLAQTSYKITGDGVGYIREAVELTNDCELVYFQGAAGNCNAKSRISSEMKYSDGATYGKLMAEYVTECLNNNMVAIETKDILVESQIYKAEANHQFDDVVYHAREVQAIWNATNSQQAAKEAGAPYGIRSPYHANAIVSNANAGAYHEMDIKTIQLGETLAWCTSPGESFTESSEWVEQNSPYQFTLYNSYSNGGANYMPSEYCYTYSSYETDVTKTMPGTAEKVNAEHVRMLNEMFAK